MSWKVALCTEHLSLRRLNCSVHLATLYEAKPIQYFLLCNLHKALPRKTSCRGVASRDEDTFIEGKLESKAPMSRDIHCGRRIYNVPKSFVYHALHCDLELRQYKNDSIQSKIIPTLKLPRFFTPYTGREEARQFQNLNCF